MQTIYKSEWLTNVLSYDALGRRDGLIQIQWDDKDNDTVLVTVIQGTVNREDLIQALRELD